MILTPYFVTDLLICISTVILLLYLYFTRNFNYWRNRKMPFRPPVPFAGNILDCILLKKTMGELFADLYFTTIEPVLGVFILDEPGLIIRDPKIIKNVLVNDFNHFHDHSMTENKQDDPIGSHILFVIKHPDWKFIRKEITPIFTSSKIKLMFALMHKSSEELVEFVRQGVRTNPAIEIRNLFERFSTDVICSTIFGFESNCFKDDASEIRTVSKRLFDWDSEPYQAFSTRCYFLAPTLVKLLRMKILHPYCTAFLRTVFWKMMNERKVTKKSRNDLIDILIQMTDKQADGIHLDDDKLVAQAVQFFAAGFETTSATITYTLFELAKNPTIQARLRAEIAAVAGESGDLSFDGLKEMTYLEMCIKETLRKYPVLSQLDRKCNRDYKVPDTDIVIQKGVAIFVPILGLHYDPVYFPEPHTYDPERFSKENLPHMQGYVYLPFGEGPRNCIGSRFGMVNSKLGVAATIRNFQVSVCDKTQDKIRFNPKGFFLSPLGGITLNFTPL